MQAMEIVWSAASLQAASLSWVVWSAQNWIVNGIGVTASALDLTDPDAPDDQITAALYILPIVYRANIHR
jgi:hypothetical protein